MIRIEKKSGAMDGDMTSPDFSVEEDDEMGMSDKAGPNMEGHLSNGARKGSMMRIDSNRVRSDLHKSSHLQSFEYRASAADRFEMMNLVSVSGAVGTGGSPTRANLFELTCGSSPMIVPSVQATPDAAKPAKVDKGVGGDLLSPTTSGLVEQVLNKRRLTQIKVEDVQRVHGHLQQTVRDENTHVGANDGSTTVSVLQGTN